jgi:prepilin-type N-terminal cleavage/methylation domain-containing protein
MVETFEFRSRRSNEAGFSLPEILVAMAVTGLVLAAVVAAFQFGSQAFLTASGQVDAQQNSRWALQRIMSDVRAAGYDPTGASFAAITNRASTSLTLQNDLNGNGVIDPPAGPCDPGGSTEQVRYRLVAGELRRSTNPADPACEAAVLGGVQNLNLSFLDAAGGALTDNAADDLAVRIVVVSITLAPEVVSNDLIGAINVTMVDQVRLRNRG